MNFKVYFHFFVCECPCIQNILVAECNVYDSIADWLVAVAPAPVPYVCTHRTCDNGGVSRRRRHRRR